ncbi:DUF6328 family protein [Yinghuangia sp. ASG 101]|uniref:DUF6328 family protein n=1 Tax=Yinghuangia sp. ASG 101 TaxID=2896848 RepID=UPI001E46F0D7|nr:DUF6328 family protein [Yinghuangia sp. ASG 101]UGQ10312.1 DUF6328 family protein [Yinghuangia sp. ASG 101]
MEESASNGEERRDESRSEQADRRWNELLQEVRVVQTGAQILFGFLLSVAFTARFAALTTFERGLYIAAVCFGAAATGTLVGVVLLHFAVSGLRRKPSLVRLARRLVLLGVALLAVTVACVLLLLLLVVTGGSVAWITVSVVLAWFAVCWVVLPVSLRLRVDRERTRPGDADA